MHLFGSVSPLQKILQNQVLELPPVLSQGPVTVVEGEATFSVAHQKEIAQLFPNLFGKKILTFISETSRDISKEYTVGVILSGGPAPGGHNVIAGLFDALKAANPKNRLIGFLGGPGGILEGKYRELKNEEINSIRNMGGFDVIGSGRTKLETTEQFEKAVSLCQTLQVNAIVIIGGDDSNTNAALLAEYLLQKKIPIQVIGVPKTIDGDLKNTKIETSFGFDTATKVYAELVGNIAKDAKSSGKYWHFIKLMGRSASHITLEAALQTHPNVTLISEEVSHKKITLNTLVDTLSVLIQKRADLGKNFGLVLIPEGLIEAIPEMKTLISELNTLLAKKEEAFKMLSDFASQVSFIVENISEESADVFQSLPQDIQAQMMRDRDDHGNVTVSQIETDKLLISLCSSNLKKQKEQGNFKGKFSPLSHFLGYEGRCATPTLFDASYAYSLGFSAFQLIRAGVSGYMTCIKNTWKPVAKWIPGGIPITMMMHIEERKGHKKAVIQKALTDLQGKPFKTLEKNREEWALSDQYLSPGPIQYFGPKELSEQVTATLLLENSGSLVE
jgi:pyrophosphate--fructose-6-phosphate 1-phosphotransferase